VIKELSVKNFKSIKELEIDCRKINLFIGESNAGKSNILEVLGLLSWCAHGREGLKDFVRLEYMENLFYDNSTDEPVRVTILRKPESSDLSKADEVRPVEVQIALIGETFRLTFSRDDADIGLIEISDSGRSTAKIGNPDSVFRFTKFYRFEKKEDLQGREPAFLMPPDGSNMFRVVSGSKKLRESVSAFFRDLGFKLMLRTRTKTFEFLKEVDDVIFNYPYILASDTLQRMVFYTVAIESNKNSTLIFEEPESHAFPYYTKFLGEKIALDESNQYFIATHNPYLLLSILEKAPEDDVNVFIAQFKDYQTKVKCLSDEEVSELMDYDPFFNLDSFIEDEDENAEEDEEELQ